MREHTIIQTTLGPLTLEAEVDGLTSIRFGAFGAPSAKPGGLLERAEQQILEYLEGRRRAFSLPLRLPATATGFQRRAWCALAHIPYGEVKTYGTIAAELGTSARAVGGACARNPLPVVVPCHRVVARSGLGGFSGQWETGIALETKRALLRLEAGGGPPGR